MNHRAAGEVAPDQSCIGQRIEAEAEAVTKAEHTPFEVPTVSLHVHERIDPRTIIEHRGGARDTF